jgi:hypothetical protein
MKDNISGTEDNIYAFTMYPLSFNNPKNPLESLQT